MKIVIIDYGMGNIKSIQSVFKYHKVDDVIVSSNYEDIKSSDKIILPGVGSFAQAMHSIRSMDLHNILDEVVIKNKKPILGICLGMQLMTNLSEENGTTQGLGYFDAKCKKFEIDNLKIPHIGYNQVSTNSKYKLFDGIKNESDFYFTHSYYISSDNDINQSYCEYGHKFVVAFEQDNIAGVQFHPELSQTNGLKLIKNFIDNF